MSEFRDLVDPTLKKKKSPESQAQGGKIGKTIDSDLCDQVRKYRSYRLTSFSIRSHDSNTKMRMICQETHNLPKEYVISWSDTIGATANKKIEKKLTKCTMPGIFLHLYLLQNEILGFWVPTQKWDADLGRKKNPNAITNQDLNHNQEGITAVNKTWKIGNERKIMKNKNKRSNY